MLRTRAELVANDTAICSMLTGPAELAVTLNFLSTCAVPLQVLLLVHDIPSLANVGKLLNIWMPPTPVVAPDLIVVPEAAPEPSALSGLSLMTSPTPPLLLEPMVARSALTVISVSVSFAKVSGVLSAEVAVEPEPMLIVPPELAVSVTATVEQDVTPVAVMALPLMLQTCVPVAPVVTLHLMPRVMTVPFGTVRVLSKVKVVSEPLVARADGTLLPVLRAVVPFHTWQEVSSPMVPVCVSGIEDMRTSSPDCEASSCTCPRSTPCAPATMFCEDGWVDIVTVRAADLTVMVFMSKVPCVRAMVLPDV